MSKTLALSELRRVAERSRMVKKMFNAQSSTLNVQRSTLNPQSSTLNAQRSMFNERIPWKVWYVAASNGDCIIGEECVTLAVYPEQGSRLVMFTASCQTRRLRDCCILQADDFILRV